MDDTLFTMKIANYPVYMRLGVFQEEHRQEILCLISININYPMSNDQDQLAHTLDYGKVITLIDDLYKNTKYSLIESAIDSLAKKLVHNFAMIHTLEIEICKTKLPGNLAKTGQVSIARHYTQESFQ